MFYVVSFDGCGIDSPLQSRSAIAALALAEEAERNGCENILVQVPGGNALPVEMFALQYCAPAQKANNA